jgi:hypothetical protein
MMELRCPECVSPEVEPADLDQITDERRCGNCGARCPRHEALVTVLDAETPRVDPSPPPLFSFDAERAEFMLRQELGPLATINPHSDADELNGLLDGARGIDIILAERERAALYIYPMSLSEPDPILAVDPGVGPTLLGDPLKLRQGEGEDPITFTVRFLSEALEEANALAAGRAADSARLDRIAGRINVPCEVQGADFLEFVEGELRASGRPIDVGE